MSGIVLSRDVKAIVYRHIDDGKLYVHAFGPSGDAVELRDVDGGVTIDNLPKRSTNVRAVAVADGTVRLEDGGGKSLWGTFDV